MDLLDNENIFQIEVILEDVRMESPCDSEADTFVTFTFMQTGPFYMIEPEPPTQAAKCGAKLGKSVVFTLTPQRIQELRNSFGLCLALYKRVCGKKILIGFGETCLIDMYNELLQNVCNCGPPKTQCMRDCIQLLDDNKCPAGVVCLYLRISCYGKFIVTSLKLNMDPGDSGQQRRPKSGRSYDRDRRNSGTDCSMGCPDHSDGCNQGGNRSRSMNSRSRSTRVEHCKGSGDNESKGDYLERSGMMWDTVIKRTTAPFPSIGCRCLALPLEHYLKGVACK